MWQEKWRSLKKPNVIYDGFKGAFAGATEYSFDYEVHG